MRRALAVAAAVLCLAARPAPAQLGPNLIDPTAWGGSLRDPSCPFMFGFNVYFCLVVRNGATPIDESDPLMPVYGPADPLDAIYTFATTPGAQYRVEFKSIVQPFFIGNSAFDVLWNGDSLVGGFQPEFSGDLTAAGPTSTLAFSHVMVGTCVAAECEDWGAVAAVGEVSVRQIGITATPEPATLALTAGGLALLGAGVRRRRRRRAFV